MPILILEDILSPARTVTPDIMLLERRSPVGAESEDEDKPLKEDAKDNAMAEVNDLAWEGWDEEEKLDDNLEEMPGKDTLSDIKEPNSSMSRAHTLESLNNTLPSVTIKPIDFDSLDIKVTCGKQMISTEDDFFADMEPAIPTASCLLDILDGKDEINTHKIVEPPSVYEEKCVTKFAVADNDDTDVVDDGWGEDDWGDDFTN